MKKILLTMLALMFTAALPVCAQEEQEVTEAPIIDYYRAEEGYYVSFWCDDPDAVIYYRVRVESYDWFYTDWMVYECQLLFSEPGDYMVEAYAIADGKTESEHVGVFFYVEEMDLELFHSITDINQTRELI